MVCGLCVSVSIGNTASRRVSEVWFALSTVTFVCVVWIRMLQGEVRVGGLLWLVPKVVIERPWTLLLCLLLAGLRYF